jgi:uncharacterized coiled-coil protein SlyX
LTVGRSACVTLALTVVLAACPWRARPARRPQPAATAAQPRETVTVTVRDPELERRVTQVELQLLEREAQVAELQARLDEARREVVRAMAKLQTLATRAEAASAMGEAEVALRGARPEAGPDVAQARQLLQMSAGEFDRQNYGGALYLATQAKALAGTRRGAMDGGATSGLGETPFMRPIPLQCTAQSNVREGPGTTFRIVYTVERGALLVAYSYAGEWLRVNDDAGRSGWVHLSLVQRRN